MMSAFFAPSCSTNYFTSTLDGQQSAIDEFQGGGETTIHIVDRPRFLSVPIFDPLSGVVSTVLDDERAGFERADAAFCTFDIREGILRTRDFQSATSSLTFTVDGEVDLDKQMIDFTIRLNARGLLGLITLPLRPFYGLFQFRGTGPIDKTAWDNVHFTSPPAEQNDLLLEPPPKAKVVVGPFSGNRIRLYAVVDHGERTERRGERSFQGRTVPFSRC